MEKMQYGASPRGRMYKANCKTIGGYKWWSQSCNSNSYPCWSFLSRCVPNFWRDLQYLLLDSSSCYRTMVLSRLGFRL
jgi:hypothetical protein